MAKKLVLDENEYPSNSKVRKVAPIRESKPTIEEEGALIEASPKRSRNVRRRATVKKKSFTQSIASVLLGSSGEVGSYIWQDVLLPAAKDTIQQMITSGLDMLLFGEVRNTKSRDRGGKSVISYGSYFKGRKEDDGARRRRPATRGDKFDLDSIFFDDHNEAEDTLQELCDRLEEYEEVTVADYFDTAGIDGATWAHSKYGWKDLRRAYCTHTRQGWAVVLPDPIELD